MYRSILQQERYCEKTETWSFPSRLQCSTGEKNGSSKENGEERRRSTGEASQEKNEKFELNRGRKMNEKRNILIEKFADTVTVDGLREAMLEKFLHIRLLFTIGLLLSTGFGVYEALQIIRIHMAEKSSVNILFGEESSYFPNVTICSIGLPYTDKVKAKIKIPVEVANRVWRLNISQDQFVDEVAQFVTSTYDFKAPINQTLLRYKLKTMDHVLEELPTGGFVEWLNLVLPNCSETLSNCSLNNVPFDCCSISEFVVLEGEICYQLALNNYDRLVYSMKQENEKKLVQYHRRFEVDAQFDWGRVQAQLEEHTAGFLVTIGEQHGFLSKMPVAVAGGWNAFVRLNQVTRTHDISACINGDPEAKYFSHYDDYGILCVLGLYVDGTDELLNCKMALGTFVPEKDQGCSYSQYNVLRSLSAVDSQIADDQAVYRFYKRRALAYARGEICQPKCTRWEYVPMVSYSESGPVATNLAASTVSKSKITITMANSYFEERYEQPKKSIYVAVSNVSGVMGTCIGLSIISVAQVAMYAVQLCVVKRRPEIFHQRPQHLHHCATIYPLH